MHNKINKCLICSGTQFTSLYEDTLMRCITCGFVTANINADEELLKSIYTENYFNGEEYLDYLNDKTAFDYNFKNKLRKITRLFPKESIQNVLEIGCAYGLFGNTLRSYIPSAQYKGIDVVPEPIAYGKTELKLDLILGDYLNSGPPTRLYTDVFMWDVIEHLKDPHEFLIKANKELELNGRIYITTGDIGALIPRIRKKKWRMIHPPSHLHYFSKKTIQDLLQRNGFEIVHISYPPLYRSLKQIYYSLFLLKRDKKRSIIESIYKRLPEKINIPFNTFDIMFVIAKKIEKL